jgi:hypothetical protein
LFSPAYSESIAKIREMYPDEDSYFVMKYFMEFDKSDESKAMDLALKRRDREMDE